MLEITENELTKGLGIKTFEEMNQDEKNMDLYNRVIK